MTHRADRLNPTSVRPGVPTSIAPARRRDAGLFAAALLLVVGAAPAAAQNLVVNPGFDTDLSGWSVDALLQTWDGTMDAAGSPASGSAQWTANFALPTGSTTVGLAQCITGIVPGASYEFGGVFFLTTAPPGGGVRTVVSWWADAACSTTFIPGSGVGPMVSGTGSWLPSTGTGTAPPGAAAATISFNGITSGTAGDFVVNFDDAFLQVSAEPVPAMPALWLLALGFALALAAVLLRARSVAAANW